MVQKFSKGDWVRLSGLVNSTVLNGAEGQVLSGTSEEGRYQVKIASPPAAVEAFPKGCQVKPCNMELIQREQQQTNSRQAGQPAGQQGGHGTGQSNPRGLSPSQAAMFETVKTKICARSVADLKSALDKDMYPGEHVSSNKGCPVLHRS